jgi:hypothetical protein
MRLGGTGSFGREQEWFWYTNLNDKDHFEGLGVKGGQYENGCSIDGLDWIHLAEDSEKWRAVVNMVMNLRVQQNAENFLKTSRNSGSLSSLSLHGVT